MSKLLDIIKKYNKKILISNIKNNYEVKLEQKIKSTNMAGYKKCDIVFLIIKNNN